MAHFKKIGLYQPTQPSFEQNELISQHEALEQECAKLERKKNKEQAEAIKPLLDAFLAAHETELNALISAAAPLGGDASPNHFETFIKELREPDFSLLDILPLELDDAVFKSLFNYDSNIATYYEQNFDLIDTSEFSEKSKFVIDVLRLFKPLISTIKNIPLTETDATLTQKNKEIAAILNVKNALKENLTQTLRQALLSPLSLPHTEDTTQEQMNAINRAYRCCFHELNLIETAVAGPSRGDERFSTQGLMKALIILKEKLSENAFFTLLFNDIEQVIHAHEKNLEMLPFNTYEQKKANLNKKLPLICLKLTTSIDDLSQAIPADDDDFKQVAETYDALKRLLEADAGMSFIKLSEQLKELLKDMKSTELYKPWSECKTVSEVANYVMHKIESAVRWLLECIYICSSTPETNITRENYFFKGPKKATFNAFNKALINLTEVETNLAAHMEERKGLMNNPGE